MSKEILIIDDNMDLCQSISSLLEANKFTVKSINSVKNLRNILLSGEIDLILTDVFLGEESAKDVLDIIKSINKQIPVLLMTGFPDDNLSYAFLDSKNVKDLLIKPFSENDLLKAISESTQNMSQEKENGFTSFIKVPYNAISSDVELDFDLYIKIRDSKYIKIAYKGSVLEQSRIDHYVSSELQYFYVHVNELSKVLNLGIERLEFSGIDLSRLNENEKTLFYYLGEPIFTYLSETFSDREFFEQIKKYIEICISYLMSNKNLYELLLEFSGTQNKDYFHGFSVAFVSAEYALDHASFNNSEVLKIIMGGLLHDIGQRVVPLEIILKDPVTRTIKEQAIYQSHVIEGVEILKKVQDIPDDVIKIVQQHHECIDGSGYPNHLKGSEIHLYSQIVSISNFFVGYLFSKTNREQSISLALDALRTNNREKFDEVFFNKFESFVKNRLELNKEKIE